MMCENNFKNKVTHYDIITTLNALITHFPQIAKASDFSLSKVQDFPQHIFLHIILFERIF